MNYKLAQQLKDAGFPQVWPNSDFLEIHDALTVSDIYNKPEYRDEIDPYRPTLSQLIEACGDKSVIILTIGTTKTSVLHGVSGLVCEGPTPEEAVARLYLALHDKN